MKHLFYKFLGKSPNSGEGRQTVVEMT